MDKVFEYTKTTLAAVAVGTLLLAGCSSGTSTSEPSATSTSKKATQQQLTVDENLKTTYGFSAVDATTLPVPAIQDSKTVVSKEVELKTGEETTADCDITVVGPTLDVVNVDCGGENIATVEKRNQYAVAEILRTQYGLKVIDIDNLPGQPYSSYIDVLAISGSQTLSCAVGTVDTLNNLRVACTGNNRVPVKPKK